MPEDADAVAGAFAVGAFGDLLKNSTEQEFIDAIGHIGLGKRLLFRRIAHGDWRALRATPRADVGLLSQREREVVRLLARGLTMPRIGVALSISPRTVAFHKYRAMEALGVASSAELVAHAIRLDLN
jgi:DNA-binding NarL/FixJ family response regulator